MKNVWFAQKPNQDELQYVQQVLFLTTIITKFVINKAKYDFNSILWIVTHVCEVLFIASQWSFPYDARISNVETHTKKNV